MKSPEDMLSKMKKLGELCDSYKPEAYAFVMEALDFTIKKLEKPRHISGKELLEGVRQYALKQFGPMARIVFEYWGVFKTGDFGHIVFDLIEVGLLRKCDEDSIEDFENCFDFKEAFDGKYQFQD